VTFSRVELLVSCKKVVPVYGFAFPNSIIDVRETWAISCYQYVLRAFKLTYFISYAAVLLAKERVSVNYEEAVRGSEMWTFLKQNSLKISSESLLIKCTTAYKLLGRSFQWSKRVI
jgi:hypothetical protein